MTSLRPWQVRVRLRFGYVARVLVLGGLVMGAGLRLFCYILVLKGGRGPGPARQLREACKEAA